MVRRCAVAVMLILAIQCFPCSVTNIRLIWSKNPRSSAALFRMMENDKVGFADNQGKVIIPAKFDSDANETGDFIEGLASVRLGGKWGFIDTTGNWVIPARFSAQSDFCEGLAKIFVVFIDEKNRPLKYAYGFIDKAGTFVIEPKLPSVESFSEGLAAFREENREPETGDMGHIGRAGYIDKTGAFVEKPKYSFATSFHLGLAHVRVSKGHWAYIDRTGKTVFSYEGVDFLN